MCGLCGELIVKVHWTDAVVPQLRRQERYHRVHVLNEILRHYGLKMNDWNGVKFLLSDPKGRLEIIHDFGDLWPVAERLTGGRLDPLDPDLIEALERSELGGER